ncbi:DUF6169 family protein [Arcicella rosea]|uniref:Uncharacterized protein n=1 Tax=Arcicella rosea TaxID=502909 RepID=A0A841EI71_9BACT|nr:DUF6169 family protein [Arcicella rosea]MBB6001934.1 hypothetical protein [Arcicella rosea]
MLLEQYKPYEIRLLKQTQDEFVFSFTTDYSIDYIATFKRADVHFNDKCYHSFNIYEFGFFNQQELGTIKDYRIRDTIHKILDFFMQENGHSIIYICDNLDENLEVRNYLFKKWIGFYNNQNYNTYFKKIKLTYYETYIGIISPIEDIGFTEYIKYLEIV